MRWGATAGEIAAVATAEDWFDDLPGSRLRIVRAVRRSGESPNLAPMAVFVATFAGLAASAPWRRFVFEINPVRWGADGVVAVDGLLVVEEP